MKTSFSRGFGLGLSAGLGACGFSGSTICFGFGGGGGGGGAGTASGGAGAGAGLGAACGAEAGAGWISSTLITVGGSRSRMLGDTRASPSPPAWSRADQATMRRNSRRSGGTSPASLARHHLALVRIQAR